MDQRCVEMYPDIYHNLETSVYYYTDKQKYTNRFQAMDDQYHPGFYAYDNELYNASRKNLNVQDLMIARAKQLREKYDFIRVFYSGGKDSLTVIDSFLKANCKIDEIVTYTSSPLGNPYSTCDIEFTVAQSQLQKRGLKSTILPASIDLYKKLFLENNNIFKKVPHGQIYIRTIRPPTVYTLWPKMLGPRLEGKTVVNVFGDVKPILVKKNNKVWFYFYDGNCVTLGAPDTEDFFTCSDMPELHVAQCQALSAWLDANATNEQDWNRLAMLDRMPGNMNLLIQKAKSYGRSIPDHDLLITNALGKTTQGLEPFNNYKNACCARELESIPHGKDILKSYFAQTKELHQKYNLEPPGLFPTSIYSKMHCLNENIIEDHEIVLKT